MKRIAMTLATIGVIGLGAASAATDGLLGATSTGTVDLALTAEAAATSEVQITGLEDVDFGVVEIGGAGGSTDLPPPQGIGGICVFSTGTNGFGYAVEIDAPNLVGDVSGQALSYEVQFNGAFGGSAASVSGPSPITATGFLASTDAGCTFSASDTADLFLTPNAIPTVADTYRATLSITVIAE